uniref:Uncharacterized protein n=1 Tax=Setaria italica TaxID=4555 RepID=K3ZBU5_SETIT
MRWLAPNRFVHVDTAHHLSEAITTWHLPPVAELVNGCEFFLVLFIKYLP